MNIHSAADGPERFEEASYRREWCPVLRGFGVEDARIWAVAAALERFGVRPPELRELVLAYERLGPGAAFPGFSPGSEREIAAQLGAVRSKLLDLSAIHDNPRSEYPAILPFGRRVDDPADERFPRQGLI